MVYCGKPSKGCSSCRERKIRCDQKEPTCGQCEKRQTTCPGYRNMVDLMFRDESNHVIKKATISRTRIDKKASRQANSAAPENGRSKTFSKPFLKTFSNNNNSSNSNNNNNKKRDPPLLSALLVPKPKRGGQGDDDGDGDSVGDDGDCPPHYHHHHHHLLDETLVFLLPYGPSISLQERGTAFFFSRYVATDHGCYQNYDFIYDVWRPPRSGSSFTLAQMKPADACITASITAVGLAGLSKVTACRETMMRAQQIYGVALQLANAALRDPVEAGKNSTMLGVLILGTYEFISGRTPQTLRAWQEHVNGAAALASIRGKAQFRTQAGIRMFLMLSNAVLISCIQSGLPMPHAIVHLRRELAQLVDCRRPSWRVIDPLYKALQVRHDIKTRHIVGTDHIVRSLADVEANFDALIRGLPASWRFTEVRLARANPAVMGRSCHVYPGLTQATAWNGIRTMRILIQETILEELLCSSSSSSSGGSGGGGGGDGIDPTTLPEHHQLAIVKAMALLRMLGEAVVGTVPQHFGIVSSRDVKRGPRSRGNNNNNNNNNNNHSNSNSNSNSSSSSNINSNSNDVIAAQAQQSSRILSTPLLPPTPPIPTHTAASAAAPPASPPHPGDAAMNRTPAARPTLLDPTQSEAGSGGGRDCDADAERFLTLATASNTIIWPLYTLGLSSSCTAETRAYIVDRLLAIHRETGLEQARIVAGMMREKGDETPWGKMRVPIERFPLLPDDALPLIV